MTLDEAQKIAKEYTDYLVKKWSPVLDSANRGVDFSIILEPQESTFVPDLRRSKYDEAMAVIREHKRNEQEK